MVWPWFLEESEAKGKVVPWVGGQMQDRGPTLGLACVSSPSQALSTLPLVTSGGRDLLDAFESTGLEGSRRLWSESQALSLRFSLLVSSPQGRTLREPWAEDGSGLWSCSATWGG